MIRRWKTWTLLVGLVAVLSAVGGLAARGTASPKTAAPRAVSGGITLTWWHNATVGPQRAYWQTVADDFHKLHPNVTVKPVPIQNEQLQNTKIPLALQSNDPPDIFQQWGGGALGTQVQAGKVGNITKYTKPWISLIGGAAAGWQYKGQQYGIPYNLGVVGFWYNKALFAKAGISSPPATWNDLFADITKLKAASIVPIAIGSKDRWPDAFYWDYLAVRLCSKQTLQQAAIDYKFTDPCWVKAGTLTKQLLDAQPFQPGFLATPAQQGASSSAGLIGNGQAAMELQGHWDEGTMNALTPNGKGLGNDLGWFPFPSVPGGKGVPGAALGGGDGYSCSWKAPEPACAQFLKYLVSVPVQTGWAKLGIGLPTAKGSEKGISDPILRSVAQARSKSPFVQTYLDVAFSTAVGQALDSAIADEFAGKKNPQQVVDAIAKSAKSKG
jgi:raffinose/stachyose/melibiose transport system substrate-binding protein